MKGQIHATPRRIRRLTPKIALIAQAHQSYQLLDEAWCYGLWRCDTAEVDPQPSSHRRIAFAASLLGWPHDGGEDQVSPIPRQTMRVCLRFVCKWQDYWRFSGGFSALWARSAQPGGKSPSNSWGWYDEMAGRMAGSIRYQGLNALRRDHQHGAWPARDRTRRMERAAIARNG